MGRSLCTFTVLQILCCEFMSLLTRPEALGAPAGVGHRAVRGRSRPAPSPGTPTARMAFHTVRCRMWVLSTVALCGGSGLALFRDADAQPAQFPGRPRPCPAKTLPQLWRLTRPGATCRVERVTGAGPCTMGGLCLHGCQADPPLASERLCCALGVEGSRLASTDTTGLPAPGRYGRTQGALGVQVRPHRWHGGRSGSEATCGPARTSWASWLQLWRPRARPLIPSEGSWGCA